MFISTGLTLSQVTNGALTLMTELNWGKPETDDLVLSPDRASTKGRGNC